MLCKHLLPLQSKQTSKWKATIFNGNVWNFAHCVPKQHHSRSCFFVGFFNVRFERNIDFQPVSLLELQGHFHFRDLITPGPVHCSKHKPGNRLFFFCFWIILRLTISCSSCIFGWLMERWKYVTCRTKALWPPAGFCQGFKKKYRLCYNRKSAWQNIIRTRNFQLAATLLKLLYAWMPSRTPDS